MTISDVQLTGDLLHDVVTQVCRAIPDDLEKVILYGSYARGEATDESDVDIMAVVDNGKELEKTVRQIMVDISYELSLAYGVEVTVLLQDKDEYEQWQPYIPFLRNVNREGIVVYERTTADTLPDNHI